MECIQCGREVNTAYCPACGQLTQVRRLTVRDTLGDFWTSVIGMDGIFLRTLKDLTVRPGFVATSFIRGIRMRYFGPIGYFFFMITMLLLWISILGMDFSELISERQQELSMVPGGKGQKAAAIVTRWFSDYIKWVLFLAVPFQAVAARYFFFRKSGYNLMEHTVPLFYISGHLFWLSMLTFYLRKSTGDMYSIPLTILSLAYFGFVYYDLMRYQSRVKSFFKGIGVYLGGQVLFILALTIVIILVVLIMALIDPESLSVFR